MAKLLINGKTGKFSDMGMTYNFDEVIDRSQSDSVKWGINQTYFGKEDVLPMWVADMDFRSPEPVVRALVERAEHGIFGYAHRTKSNGDAVVEWLKKRHGWETKPEWQLLTPGVVPAINLALLAFTQPGDKVIIQPPVYHPFYHVLEHNGRQVVENNLIEENGYYRMDFDLLAKQLAEPRVRLLILCSPHNPVGRVWTREELTRLGELCLAHNVLVISDEIHSDLVFSWAKFVPLAALSPEIAQNTVTFFAPSKTFNLAGNHTAVALIPNKALFTRYSQVIENIGVGGGTIFGMLGLETAYRFGEEWLDQLLVYLAGNMNFLVEYIDQWIPEIKVWRPEGTYLVWLDCRALGMTPAELRKFFIEQAGLGLNDGYVFGPLGAGFMRLNAGCPRATLAKGLEQLKKAVENLRP